MMVDRDGHGPATAAFVAKLRERGYLTWTFLATTAPSSARTDPSAPKHRVLSLFILDLNSPGVDIRPLRLIDGGSTG
jgi:alkylation response protein AidB-like acyl-CoA dehydrogenase